MTEQAALAEDSGIVFDNGVEEETAPIENNETLEATSESAPEAITNENVDKTEPSPEENPKDKIQKKFNKLTADKYTEKRRADDLQRQLDELNKPAKVDLKEPNLDDFDDDDAFNRANIAFEVQKALQVHTQDQAESIRGEQVKLAQKGFNDRIVSFGKEDFADVANRVPLLPEGVAAALTEASNGVDLIYHLGTNLEVADELAQMSSTEALMKLGQISLGMNAAKPITPSAAPEPITPLQSGGAISSEGGPPGATYE